MNPSNAGLSLLESAVEPSSSPQNFGPSEATPEAVRHQTSEANLPENLRRQAEFEHARARLSTTFINLPSDRVDGEIDERTRPVSQKQWEEIALLSP